MPYIETIDEVVEEIADMIGIYIDSRCGDSDEHIQDCNCRVNWAPRMTERLRKALANEEKLNNIYRWSV